MRLLLLYNGYVMYAVCIRMYVLRSEPITDTNNHKVESCYNISYHQ